MIFDRYKNPFLWLLFPFVSGFIIGSIVHNNLFIKVLVILFCFLLAAFIGLNLFYGQLRLYKTRWFAGLLVYILLIFAGLLFVSLSRIRIKANNFAPKRAQYLLIKINNEPRFTGGLTRFSADVEQYINMGKIQEGTGKILIYVRANIGKQHSLFCYGDEILIKAAPVQVSAPLNPAEFNYKEYLDYQGIQYQQYLTPGQLVLLNRDKGNQLISFATKLRQQLVEKLKIGIKDTDAAALASTMILGYKADLKPEIKQIFADTGTMHLLAISGMHVALFYFLISLLWIAIPDKRPFTIVKALISIGLIWLYALVTGFSPAVCRASLMISLVILGITSYRQINRLNLLAFAAFALLLLNPILIYDAGFQLSFVAVGGIIVFQPIVYSFLTVNNPVLKKLWVLCSVSIAAQIAIFPLGAFYFHRFPTFFLLSNLIVIIPSAIVMYGGIIYLLLPSNLFIAKGLGWLIEKTIIAMIKILNVIEFTPLASIDKIWLNTFEVVLLYFLIASVFLAIRLKNKYWFYTGLLTLLFLVSITAVKSITEFHARKLIFFSLNRKTAILYKRGRIGYLLTDLKSNDKVFQYSVQPCIDSLMINQIKFIALNKAKDEGDDYIKTGNLIQFGTTRLIMFDKSNYDLSCNPPLRTDYIYVTLNPFTNLYKLKQSFNFKKIIVAGNNTDKWNRKFLQDTAGHISAKIISLKRNKAYQVESN